jgi:organic hydroperoxide reductase OsmC/OhrA
MAIYRASVDWSLPAEAGDEDFAKGRYSRGHTVIFGEAPATPATASPHIVGNKWSVPGAADPEQMLVGSASSCHMLSFLHAAREAGFVVASYRDAAEGVMENNDQGRLAVTRITLRPQIAWRGREPSAAELDRLHHAAHDICFIANSVKTEIVVEALASA